MHFHLWANHIIHLMGYNRIVKQNFLEVIYLHFTCYANIYIWVLQSCASLFLISSLRTPPPPPPPPLRPPSHTHTQTCLWTNLENSSVTILNDFWNFVKTAALDVVHNATSIYVNRQIWNCCYVLFFLSNSLCFAWLLHELKISSSQIVCCFLTFHLIAYHTVLP